jgi:hypothetical protein
MFWLLRKRPELRVVDLVKLVASDLHDVGDLEGV